MFHQPANFQKIPVDTQKDNSNNLSPKEIVEEQYIPQDLTSHALHKLMGIEFNLNPPKVNVTCLQSKLNDDKRADDLLRSAAMAVGSCQRKPLTAYDGQPPLAEPSNNRSALKQLETLRLAYLKLADKEYELSQEMDILNRRTRLKKAMGYYQQSLQYDNEMMPFLQNKENNLAVDLTKEINIKISNLSMLLRMVEETILADKGETSNGSKQEQLVTGQGLPSPPHERMIPAQYVDPRLVPNPATTYVPVAYYMPIPQQIMQPLPLYTAQQIVLQQLQMQFMQLQHAYKVTVQESAYTPSYRPSGFIETYQVLNPTVAMADIGIRNGNRYQGKYL